MSPERERAKLQVENIRRICNSIDVVLRDGALPGLDAAQAITQEATSLAMTLARIDAVERVGGGR